MSKRGTEFIEKWIEDNFHGRALLGRDRRPHDWAQQCVSDAIAVGIPETEIEEDFGDLEEFMARAITEVADEKAFDLEAIAMEADRPILTVEVDGKTFSGTYEVANGLVTVSTGYARKTAHVGDSRPEVIARSIFKTLVQEEKQRPDSML